MTTTFTDNFSSPSPLWSNLVGNWTGSGGIYFAQAPSNNPLTYSGLPFDFTNSNLQVTVTVNGLSDGGIWLDSNGTENNGVLLVLGGNGYGLGARGGGAGNSVYWALGTNIGEFDSPFYNEVQNVFTPGGTYTITVLVNGDTYEAFKDPDGVFDANSVLLTTLVNSTFSSGHVGLYDFDSAMSFSNFSVVGENVMCTVTVSNGSSYSVSSGQTDTNDIAVDLRSALAFDARLRGTKINSKGRVTAASKLFRDEAACKGGPEQAFWEEHS